jgi:HEAT repeat protein
MTGQLERLTRVNFNLPLDERPDSEVQLLIDTMRTLQAIGKLREPVAVQCLTPLLEHNEIRIKGVTVVALGNIGSTEAVDALCKTYPKYPLFVKEDTKQSKDLRILWIQTLGRIHDQRAINLLTKIKADPNTQIGQAATKALKRTTETQEPNTDN